MPATRPATSSSPISMPRADYLEKLFPVGEKRYVSGTTALYDGMLQMVHPDRVVDEKGLAALPMVEPVYPLTEGLGINQVRKAADAAAGKIPALPEWQDAAWLTRNRLPSFGDALLSLHRPAEPSDIAPQGPAWSRLAYDELLASQIALTLVRAHLRRQSGRGSAGDGRVRKRIVVGAALFTDVVTAQGDRGHRLRSRQAGTHAAHAARRCRIGKDRGRADGRRGRDRKRTAGGADGADRNPRPPASENHRAAGAKPPTFTSPSSPAASAARSALRFSRGSKTAISIS